MDSWTEEQREVWKTAMDALLPGRDPEETGAGRYLLRHLLHVPWHIDGPVRYYVAEDFRHEHARHPHSVS